MQAISGPGVRCPVRVPFDALDERDLMIRQCAVNAAPFIVCTGAEHAIQWLRAITQRERNCNDLQCADTNEEARCSCRACGRCFRNGVCRRGRRVWAVGGSTAGGVVRRAGLARSAIDLRPVRLAVASEQSGWTIGARNAISMGNVGRAVSHDSANVYQRFGRFVLQTEPSKRADCA